MAFAARNENGVWRLCKRAGDTIIHVKQELWPDITIRFSSQAKAKACADALNERFWKDYERHERKSPTEPNPHFHAMLEVIYQHEGLDKDEYRRITG